MNIRRIILSVFIPLFLTIPSVFGSFNNKPTGLMTDLIEHTELVYCDGYITNMKLWETDKSTDPLNYAEIRSAYPSFSWIVPGKEKNTTQTAYRILLANSYQGALNESDNVWDSGQTNSAQSVSILYTGTALQPDKVYFWKVKTFTNNRGESDWSAIKAFRTAKSLKPYQTSFYPLVKSAEYPVRIIQRNTNSQFIDFGKAAFGQLKVTLSSSTNTDTVIIHLAEKAVNNVIDRKPGGTIRYQQYSLPLLQGTHTYQIKIRPDARNTGRAAILMPDYIGEVLPFRYCEIENYPQALLNTAVCRESVHYPFNDTSSGFKSSNDILNQVWEMCKYSIKATSFAGIYVDGDRERIPYEADALINQLCHYQVDREYSMARRSHEYLLEYPTWPTEWIMQSVLIAWYDYMYTGDSRSLETNYDLLKSRTLMQLKDSASLITTTAKEQKNEFLSSIRFKGGNIKDIVDWPHTGILGLGKSEGGEADGFVFTNYNSVTNAYHYEAIKILAEIAAVLNKKEEEAYFRQETEAFAKIYNNSFFDKQSKYYLDGTATTHASLHANMFPMAFGLVSDKQKKEVMNFVRSRGMACSVYGSQFLMDALYEASDGAYALSLLTSVTDRSWYNMIRSGSTISFEAWDDKYKPNQDWNHAWGAVPANIIPRRLMGVTPLTPGFGTIRIQPQTDTLSFAQATIPTIRGEIIMQVSNQSNLYQLDITIPANMNAEVYLPLLSDKYDILIDNHKIKARKTPEKPFVYLGKIGSGTYQIKMTAR